MLYGIKTLLKSILMHGFSLVSVTLIMKYSNSLINKNESVVGVSIERKVEKITESKEPITDGAPLIYTERKEGVIPAYDVRTDRFEIAIEAMGKVVKSNIAKREQAAAKKAAEAAAAKKAAEAEAATGTAAAATTV